MRLICCDVRVPCKAATMHADALRRVASCHVISRLRQDAVNKLQRLLASMCRPAAMSKAGSALTVYCRHTEPPLVRCGRHWSSSRRARSLHNRCSARTSWVHAEVGPCGHCTHARMRLPALRYWRPCGGRPLRAPHPRAGACPRADPGGQDAEAGAAAAAEGRQDLPRWRRACTRPSRPDARRQGPLPASCMGSATAVAHLFTLGSSSVLLPAAVGFWQVNGRGEH